MRASTWEAFVRQLGDSRRGRRLGGDMSNVLPTIHIVDDDKSFRAGVANLLDACSYGVKQYASAEQLLRDPPIDDLVASYWICRCQD